MKRCPACATELPDDARHCGRCRAVQPQVPPPEDPTHGFTDEATRSDPRAVSAALSMMRHPTGVVSGVSRDDVEDQIRRATREVEQTRELADALEGPPIVGNPGNKFSGDDADDFEGGATQVDTELVSRLTAQAAAHEPRNAGRKAPISMMPVDPPPPRPLRPTPAKPGAAPLAPTQPWMPAVNAASGAPEPSASANAPSAKPLPDAPPEEDPPQASTARFPLGLAVGAAAVVLGVASLILLWVTGRLP